MYRTAREYTLALEAEQRRIKLARRPLAERITLMNKYKPGVMGLLEEVAKNDLAAWEACGGNGGERL